MDKKRIKNVLLREAGTLLFLVGLASLFALPVRVFVALFAFTEHLPWWVLACITTLGAGAVYAGYRILHHIGEMDASLIWWRNK